jgi:hypothetical protein
MLGNSRVAAQLVASQEGLSSMELISSMLQSSFLEHKWYCKTTELHIQRRDSEPKCHVLCDDTIQLQRLTANEWYRMIVIYEDMRNWEDNRHVPAFVSRDKTMCPFITSETEYPAKQCSVVCNMRSQTQLIYLKFSQLYYEEFCLLQCNIV